MTEFRVRRAQWPRDEAALAWVRRRVFIEEQQVPEELEWDGLDGEATHLLAEDANGAPIGTARLLADGHIGRMAVMQPWRGRGVGRSLLETLMNTARERGLEAVFLHAQVEAIPFYERSGFVAEGDVFMDAGIPHRTMHRAL
jgi:predicted GNAT family N-acyltransferase